jgi:hypothetical protein
MLSLVQADLFKTRLIAFVLGLLVLLLVAQGLGWVFGSTLALRGTPVPASTGVVSCW